MHVLEVRHWATGRIWLMVLIFSDMASMPLIETRKPRSFLEGTHHKNIILGVKLHAHATEVVKGFCKIARSVA